MINLSIICYCLVDVAPITNISGCVSFFGKMSRLILSLKTKLYQLIIHVYGKVQGPTLTGNLRDKHVKNIFECSNMPQDY